MNSEKRLIDANELLKILNIEASKYENNGYDEWLNGIYLGLDKAIDKIEDAPTVDAVEVVRCKDCKHYVWDEFDGCNVCICLSKYVKPDFWCAHGERKDDGKEKA